MKKLITLLTILFLSIYAHGTDSTYNKAIHKRQLNFFIISKPKKGKIDLASRFNIIRTKVRGFFLKNRFVSIVAGSAEDMNEKVQYRLNKSNASIGTLWFDSHGIYKKGHSLFLIGKDEFNYQSVRDPNYSKPFERLAPYCTDKTSIVIGSCYGGATFKRASLYSPDTLRMNGDSLMMGLAADFKNATVYASESWVMTRPGLFKKRASVAGYPLRKLFRDVVYRPAWENVGLWNEYSTSVQKLMHIPPVTMDKYGDILICQNYYTSKGKVKRMIDKKMRKLHPGLLKV
jgi:hypothetical protein